MISSQSTNASTQAACHGTSSVSGLLSGSCRSLIQPLLMAVWTSTVDAPYTIRQSSHTTAEVNGHPIRFHPVSKEITKSCVPSAG